MTRHIFDGFCHRPFDPAIDGWRDEMPDPKAYPSLKVASDMLEMFEELQRLTKENWTLRQQVRRLGGKVE